MSIAVVPALKSELMASTALTPTRHKGGIGAVIGIVAAVAIPFAAPAIAASIGLSGAIGATMGSALVGGALGAATAAVTGGNIGMGALGGAIGGGIGGYNAPSPGTPFTTSNVPAPVGASGAHPSAFAAPTSTVGLTAAPAGIPVTGADASGFISAGGTGSFNPTVATTSPIAAPSAGVRLSGGTPVSATYNSGAAAGVSGPHPSNFSAPVATAPGASGLHPSAVRAMPTPAAVGVAPTPSFSSKLSNFMGDLPDKIFSSEAAQQAGGKLLTTAMSNAMAGDTPNMTAEEKARMADLESARAFQRGQLEQKQKVSDAYVQQASSINPYYYGQQALTEEQNRLLRAQQAGLRQIRPSATGTRQATIRRNALDKSRLSGFDRGRQEAEAKRLQYMQAAQGSAPTGAGYAGAIAGDLRAADARYKRLEDETKGYAGILDPFFEETLGGKSQAERDREREERGIAR